MLDIPQISNTLDQDQNQFLNGKGSAAIILNKNNETSTQFYNIASKTVLSKFFKSRIFDYLTVLGLALIVLLVMQYENKYPLRINQTLVAPPTQLKDGVKQTTNKLQNATLSKKIQQTKLQLQSFNNKRENDNFLAGSNQITKPKQIAIPTQTPPTSNAGATGGITVAELSSTTISAAQIANAKRWMDLKNENIFQNTPLAQQQRTYYQKKYNISKYKQLPICLVIPSYNNVEDNRYTNNIRSVVMQEYTNYHIVFIDDASTDGTGQQVQSFLANQKKVPKDRYKVIRNKQQKKAMPNLRMAAKEYCLPQDIYIIVDGDDQLIGRQTLKIFNSAFQSKQVWFVYSNFLNIKGTIGYSRAFPPTIIENNRYRVYPFVTSHLRAFYTQLFLNINQNDLKNEAGEYLKAANDVAICLPILEMSHQKVFYLQQVTYFYNSNTGQNNHQLRAKQQKMNDRLIRRRKRYALLEHLQFASKNTNPRLLSLQNIFQSEKQQFFKNSE